MPVNRRVSYAMAMSSLWALIVPSAALAFVAPPAHTNRTPHAGHQKHISDKTHSAPKIGMRVLRPALVSSATDGSESFAKGTHPDDIKLDALSRVPRLIQGAKLAATKMAAAPLGKNAVTAYMEQALAYLDANPDLFGVTSADLMLNEAATLIDDDVAFLKFQVLRDGLLIQDAVIDFRFKQGVLLQVVNQSFAEALSDNSSPDRELEQVARDSVNGQNTKPTGERYRVVATQAGYKLVRVSGFEVLTATDRYLVQVEAASGQVFEIRPTTFHLEGSASGHVYPRYYAEPIETRPYGELSLSYDGGTVTTKVDGNFADAPNDAEPSLDGFIGPRVKINLRSGTKVVASGVQDQDRWNVVFSRTESNSNYSDKSVAQSMVFYHTNAIIQRAKAYIDTTWLDRRLTANVNLTQTCNAHWDGSTINFYSSGSGCANTGLISDVVFHEWGHGLDENTGGIDDGAFSEGFGDIMSLLMTHSNVLGIGFRTDGRPVRDLEPDKIYPRDRGPVHAEGLIIGGTFWDLFKDLRDQHGEVKADELISRYAFKVIFTASRYTDVYDALLVIDDDNADLSDKTPNFCAINKAFTLHGLASADESCL